MASIKIEDISSNARFTFDKLNSGKLLDKAFMPTAYIKTFLSSNQFYENLVMKCKTRCRPKRKISEHLILADALACSNPFCLVFIENTPQTP